jgi:hypothetical protein
MLFLLVLLLLKEIEIAALIAAFILAASYRAAKNARLIAVKIK